MNPQPKAKTARSINETAFRASARRSRRHRRAANGDVPTDEQRAMAFAQAAIEPTIAVHSKDGELSQQPVRRIAWVLAFGEHLHEDEIVYSTCGNASCTLPEHLAKFRMTDED